MKKAYPISFRCYFPGAGNIVNHYQTMPLRDIPKWIEAYLFTHPNVESISVKFWPHDGEENA
ncbi:hypothetical protein [Dysosmobacter sp.]|uniref:hypothetical protein n=1 Tax=Dysosmobacter sp. TaxID=2591382 RepID=UPI002A881EA3|nr:hypothetical protein [Dysosmobacter sp.]MDY3281294.1 hypothetical protein [Dysosmobacter sp.]